MNGEGIEVTKFNWGPGHLSGSTDTSWIELIEQANGDLRILQRDMGPETEVTYGSYDYERAIRITSADRAQFTALLLSFAFDGVATLSWDKLKDHCIDWGVPFQGTEGAIG